ncbi:MULTISPECIES: type IV pilus twitching motility protein PilT [unclassified Modestobacter]|uniref:type IV pilus twitching motility protein PilT n=1 Tax=unclassified Modestobacter TaxID=2643866 RepID=UPI0022AA8632|nr:MULTISPECIES: type IV pilus twitching motility protein PilT [unclassified Modestobacter]
MSETPGDTHPEAGDIDLDAALRHLVASGASDLHLTAGSPPVVRIHGTLHPLTSLPVLTSAVIQRTLYSVLDQQQRAKFEAELELDFAHALRGVGRFRVNVYRQRDSVGAAIRAVPNEIKPLEELGLPSVVHTFAGLPRGLVLVTGPTGSGKSTTLASLIDLANRTRADHIMTIEDPIEFMHRHARSLVNQREVGSDTHSFGAALRHVLRQDPDIILLGEMRDLETISVALTAAETGHLVLASLHTQDAAQTINRVIDVFPAHQQQQVRAQLAGSLQGVVCQSLCRRADGTGRVVAAEVLVATPAIRNLIREGKSHQIYSAMQAGADWGMTTMDQQLAKLVSAGHITFETGLDTCRNADDFTRLTGRSPLSRIPLSRGDTRHSAFVPGT